MEKGIADVLGAFVVGGIIFWFLSQSSGESVRVDQAVQRQQLQQAREQSIYQQGKIEGLIINGQ